MLRILAPRKSYRDPLPEFTEHLVAALLGARLAGSPVQPRWDIELPNGDKIQVKYVINKSDAPGAWVNEHAVRVPPDVNWHAVVLMEGFVISVVLVLPADLGARMHGVGQDPPRSNVPLQLGRRNWQTIRTNPEHFRPLGVRVLLPPFVNPGTRHRPKVCTRGRELHARVMVPFRPAFSAEAHEHPMNPPHRLSCWSATAGQSGGNKFGGRQSWSQQIAHRHPGE
jgi:hypothetical protein